MDASSQCGRSQVIYQWPLTSPVEVRRTCEGDASPAARSEDPGCFNPSPTPRGKAILNPIVMVREETAGRGFRTGSRHPLPGSLRLAATDDKVAYQRWSGINNRPYSPPQPRLTTTNHASPISTRPGRHFSQDLGVLDIDRPRQRRIADPTNNRIQGDGHNFIGRKPPDPQGLKPPHDPGKWTDGPRSRFQNILEWLFAGAAVIIVCSVFVWR